MGTAGRTSASRADGVDTRARLLEAAERLFAERGADAVSMREIARSAGARNVIASQYWFGDKAGVIQALLDKHTPEVEARRHALLDAYESTSGAGALLTLAGALVYPLGSKLEQGDAGAGYLRTLSDLLTRPNPSTAEPLGSDDPSSSLRRWGTIIEPFLEPGAVSLHRRFLTMRFVAVEVALRSRSGRTDHALFLSDLTDVVAGQLTAPISERTSRLRRERAAGTGGGADARADTGAPAAPDAGADTASDAAADG